MTKIHPFQNPAWYRATTLSERLIVSRAANPPVVQPQTAVDRGQDRLQRWRSQTPFTKDSYFAKRLAQDDLTEAQLQILLSESSEAIRDRFSEPPFWLAKLEQAYANLQADLKLTGFLALVEPLIQRGREQLLKGIQTVSCSYPTLPIDIDHIVKELLPSLLEDLIQIISRTLVLELNVARLQGDLIGETPEARFQDFCQRLRRPEVALAIWQEYPVLARQVLMRIDHWRAANLEFLQRLGNDWEAIKRQFCQGRDPGKLIALGGGAGDKHRAGRSVIIAHFASGFRLVYKPRSLAVDQHFQALLSWLNQRGDHPPFATLEILDRAAYGWVEYVASAECQSVAEVDRFYQRQGGYLALLYILEAIDFHYENIIAAGEQPMLIDLEALFHPRSAVASPDLAAETLGQSVLRISLLPQRLWAAEGSEGVDFSGLGMLPNQLTPEVVPQWQQHDTDEMHLVKKQMVIPTGQNRPRLQGAAVNILDFAESILQGFSAIYRLLQQHRTELLAPDGPLARFAQVEIRVVLRPTEGYFRLLEESFHPDVLRDALDRERLFDNLWLGVRSEPALTTVIPAERADLFNGDIPVFTTQPGSRHLWTSNGQRLDNFFAETGQALVDQRLQKMNQADLQQQSWFIRAALTALAMTEDRAHHPTYSFQESGSAATSDNFLAAAQAVGDRLLALALRGQSGATWLGLRSDRDYWALEPLGLDLYDGSLGPMLFLAYLGAVSGKQQYSDLAHDAFQACQAQLAQQQANISLGGFTGLGGIIYVLSHLATLWSRPDLLDQAESLAIQSASLIEQDQLYDLIGGGAGFIGGLLCLYRARPAAQTLALAIRCGDHLLAEAQRLPHGLGWSPSSEDAPPLTGFSHGAAGIAWALVTLATASGEERFLQAARQAIAYERYHFVPEVSNWADLRRNPSSATPQNDALRFGTTWCHGAPGIGLARLYCLPHLADPAFETEIEAAVTATLAAGFGQSHALCHGDLGNLEFLHLAGMRLDQPQLQQRVDRIAAGVLDSIHDQGWLCSLPLGAETPGFMVGLSGIGYGLLRLVAPSTLPSVLALEPPNTL